MIVCSSTGLPSTIVVSVIAPAVDGARQDVAPPSTSSQQPAKGAQRASSCCAPAEETTPSTRTTSAQRPTPNLGLGVGNWKLGVLDSFISVLSEQNVNPCAGPKAREVDWIEALEVVAEVPRRPQVAPIEGEEPSPVQSDIDTAEHLCAWRPPLGLEHVGEDGAARIEGVDEVAGLLESIPEHTSAGADVGHNSSRHPRESANLPAARRDREPDVASQIQLCQR